MLIWLGRVGGVVGVILCAIALLARLRGVYTLEGFQVGTLLLGGIGAMVFGCLGYIAAIAEHRRD